MISSMEVIETDNGTFFKITENGRDILFNKLLCDDTMKGGMLLIVRGGKIIGFTSSIGPEYTDGVTSFLGLDDVLEGYDPYSLRPRFFEIGDVLNLETPDDFISLAAYVKKKYLEYKAMDDAFNPAEGGVSITLIEDVERRFDQNINAIVDKIAPDIMKF